MLVYTGARERAAHESEPSTTALCTELPAISNPILSEKRRRNLAAFWDATYVHMRYNTMKFVGIGEERSLHMKFFIHFFSSSHREASLQHFFSSLLLSFFFLRRVFLLEHSLSLIAAAVVRLLIPLNIIPSAVCCTLFLSLCSILFFSIRTAHIAQASSI